MGTQLNEQAYQKLIDENIAALNKHMPEHSLEKKHTIEVLKWSVLQIYHSGEAERPDESSGLHLADVKECVAIMLHDYSAIGMKDRRDKFDVVDCNTGDILFTGTGKECKAKFPNHVKPHVP